MWGKLVWELLALPCLRSPMLLGAFVTDGPSGGVASAILLAVVGARQGSPLLMLALLLLRSSIPCQVGMGYSPLSFCVDG